MKTAPHISDIRVVSTSLLVSVSDVGLNLVVALITGSTVMLAQALQGLSDLITAMVLFAGVRRSRRAADTRYQFGYGREIFFWVLVAGVCMFLGTGGLSVYFGYQQLMRPVEIEFTGLAFAMLGFGLITNSFAFRLSLQRLKQTPRHMRWWQQLRDSSIVETKATLLIDFMGTVSAVFGLIALSLYALTGNTRFDGLGSVVIGLSMMIASMYLIRDVRDLIVGRSVDTELAAKITSSAESVAGIMDVLDLRTMYLGSGKLLVIIEVHVEDHLTTDQIEKVVDAVKHTVQRNIPEAQHIQVEIETPEGEL